MDEIFCSSNLNNKIKFFKLKISSYFNAKGENNSEMFAHSTHFVKLFGWNYNIKLKQLIIHDWAGIQGKKMFRKLVQSTW